MHHVLLTLRTLLLIAITSTWSHAGPNLGRLVIIGDSITQAQGGSGAFAQNGNRGYRWHLFKDLVDAGASFDLVGSLNTNYLSDSHYPTWRGTVFDRSTEGHFGWRAFQILGTSAGPESGNRGKGNIREWTRDENGGYTADTALLMIGINELAGTSTPEQLQADVNGIIDVLQADNPNVRIYLMELLHVGQGHPSYGATNDKVDQFNVNKLPEIAATKTTSSSVVSVVSMRLPKKGTSGTWPALEGEWNANLGEMTYDRVHPNSRGERHVASCISRAIGLSSEWTSVPIQNADFEGGFSGIGSVNCRPNDWTLFGTPNSTAVPQRRQDYSIVAESTVDTRSSGTGSQGSSYLIAGHAETGIEQTLSSVLEANRRYMLQVSLYAGSSALTASDYAVEVWAGSLKIGEIDNRQPVPLFTAGTSAQIGSKLKEFTVEFDSNQFPSAWQMPLRIRLISRNVARYVGFEDVRLSWKPSPAPAQSRHYSVYVLTGQSNSLGTTNGTEIDRLPGADSADPEIPFWWHNVADANISIGSSGGFWRSIQPQRGGYYAGSESHWGPEINFARTMYHAGHRDFCVIKASRGGGGNGLWDKARGGHMYTHLVNTVRSAADVLVEHGHTFEVAGLLYLQGESNDSAEASGAGGAFRALVDNLRSDLPNAGKLKGYIIGNVHTGSNPETTRAQQEAIASEFPEDIVYVDSLDLQDELVGDNLHHNKMAKLINGARFAYAVLGDTGEFDAKTNRSDIAGIHYGNSGGGTGGTAPVAGLAPVLTGQNPMLQGWSEERHASSTSDQSANGLSSEAKKEYPAWNVTDADTFGDGYHYTRRFSNSQLAEFAAKGWNFQIIARFPKPFAETESFCFQYGDGTWRWIVYLQRTASGALIAKGTGAGGLFFTTLQEQYDGAFHLFAIRKSPTGNGVLVFDGHEVGAIEASPADSRFEPGLHFGTVSDLGKGSADVARVKFQRWHKRFGEWQARNFGAEILDELVSGPFEDPDADGLTNLFEYAQNTNPLVPSVSLLQEQLFFSGLDQYTALSITKNPSATDVIWTGEASEFETPEVWSTDGVVVLEDSATTFRIRDAVPKSLEAPRNLGISLELMP